MKKFLTLFFLLLSICFIGTNNVEAQLYDYDSYYKSDEVEFTEQKNNIQTYNNNSNYVKVTYLNNNDEDSDKPTMVQLNDDEDESDRKATESDFTGNLSCGETRFQFHKSLPNFTSTMYDILKIVTPIIVIVTGMLDLLKAVSAQKEDEIKKGQQKLLRRLLAGSIVFLVFVIVETAVNIFADNSDARNAMHCVNCFLGGANKCTEMTQASQWKEKDGKWYAYSSSGFLLKGWQEVNWSGGNNWFYFDKEDGHMLTGWQKLKWKNNTAEDWFYFDNKDGHMLTGWQELDWYNEGTKDKDWFYFDPAHGNLIQNKCLNIDNKNYCFDKDGVWYK